MNRYIYSYFMWLLCGVWIAFTACQDDDLGFFPSDTPKGETMVSIEASFEPFSAKVLTRATLTPPGRGMNSLSDLCLLAYDMDGKLMEGFPIEVVFTSNDIQDEPRVDGDASNGNKAEDDTKCLKKNVKLPFGNYYLVAVANLGKYVKGADDQIVVTTSTLQALSEGGKFEGQYSTLDALRKMKVTWNVSDYRDNREMLGYFTVGKASTAPDYTSEFPLVTINKPNMSLHTWLRRCASKITIDFDGSGLRENVSVYIKDARIYDIPKECTLGFGKEFQGDGYEPLIYNNTVINEEELIKSNSHVIEYGSGNYTNWPRIAKGSPYIEDENENKIDFHSQESPALFFYENMQGDAPYGKLPIADLVDGGVIDKDVQKDGKPYGTYIEVTGYYYSTANGNIAQGEIKYRFMIGKDVVKNCDAERNYHYKLTLKLRGNANDYDWHIDYKDHEGFDVPNPWYVSYLYNHDAMLPFKYTPPAGATVTKVMAKIIENPWYPTDTVAPKGDYAQAFKGCDENKQIGNGFLSLRATNDVVITDKKCGYTFNGYKGLGKDPNGDLYRVNDFYYLGQSDSSKNINRSQRTYYFDDTKDDTNLGREQYSYQKNGEKITFNIPLFTRAKVLVKQTGYSGNNPYVGYTRTAKLQLTVTIKKQDGTTEDKSDTIDVIQVRRIVNPKGVYRRAGNNEDFHVRLLRLPDDNAQAFEEFNSDGPWMAEIIGDKNFITLNGRQTVQGSTNTPIDFTIKFNKLNKDNTIRNAVVRVRYHNYTCTHLIFVRQGYDPQAISPTGKNFYGSGMEAVKWRTFNQIARDSMATDPRDEGSLFKFGTSGYAIDAQNNVYGDTNGDGIGDCWAPTDFSSSGNQELKILDENGKVSSITSWSEIGKDEKGFDTGDMQHAATMHDFEQLYLTPNIQFGYGVLYADGATETQMAVNDAYGYFREDKDRAKKGMRGLFAYYWNQEDPDNTCTAKNVFFPIGRSGYGHRKNTKEATENNGKGILRYCSNRYKEEPGFNIDAPLFCALYHRPGAIYWAKEKVSKNNYKIWNDDLGTEGNAYGLDINYFSFDVNAITDSNVDNGGDACFVRCVE